MYAWLAGLTDGWLAGWPDGLKAQRFLIGKSLSQGLF